MVRELPAPVIVVVHGRKIVVDERIGMNALDGASQRHRQLIPAAAGFRRRQTKSGPDSLASGEQRIAHRFVYGGRFGGFGGQKSVKSAVDGFRARSKERFQVKRGSRAPPGGDRHAPCFRKSARLRQAHSLGERPIGFGFCCDFPSFPRRFIRVFISRPPLLSSGYELATSL